jgi:hypothetical protein
MQDRCNGRDSQIDDRSRSVRRSVQPTGSLSPTLSSRKFTLDGPRRRAYHPDLHSLPHHCSLRCPMIVKRILPCRGFAPSGSQSLPDHGKRHQGRGQGRREQPPDGRIWAQLPELGIDKGKTHSDASLCQGAPSVLLEAYGGAPRMLAVCQRSLACGLPRGQVWPSSRRSSRSFVLASLRALHLDLRRHRRQIGSDRGMAAPAPCTGRGGQG